MASQEYVTVQMLTELKCYLQSGMFNPTNLLNHVMPSVELIVQI